MLLTGAPLGAQVDLRDRRLPLAPNRPAGEAVAPFVEGWYANPDGTYTFSFGYFNFNTKESIHLPVGPNNVIEPAEFDGMQPTYFPAPRERSSGRPGRPPPGYDRRERGVFTVTVPAEYGEGRRVVVWTLTVHGETHQVTARVGHQALDLDYGPRAMGSLPPLLGFEEQGPRGQHPTGITLEKTLTTSVGEALTLTVWVNDPSKRSKDLLGPLYREIPIRLTWFMHQGPAGAQVAFERAGDVPVVSAEEGRDASGEENLAPYQSRVPSSGGNATMRATFSRPGDYVLRVRVDNFTAEDSTPGDQCCWTNGFVNVKVAP